MKAMQVMGLSLATVLVANVSAVGIYYLNQESPVQIDEVVAAAPDDHEVIAASAGITESVEPGVANLPAASGYIKTPYSEHYAVSVCEDQADSKYSGKLVHRHIVNLSTRYDDYSEFFVVVLYAHLGTRSDYSEVKVYCHVDPKTYVISYFKDYPA